MKSNGTEHFAACVVEGVDKPLALLFVSFDTVDVNSHNCISVRENIRHISLEMALLMELNKSIKGGNYATVFIFLISLA